MKIIAILILTISLCFMFSYTSISQEQIPQNEPNYMEIIKQRYKAAETSQSSIESWKKGMLTEYGLILDRLEMTYEGIIMAPTTNEKTLFCGVLLITAYSKTSDGERKRVISLRSVCHLFNKEVVEKVLVMGKEPNKLLNGWDDSVPI